MCRLLQWRIKSNPGQWTWGQIMASESFDCWLDSMGRRNHKQTMQDEISVLCICTENNPQTVLIIVCGQVLHSDNNLFFCAFFFFFKFSFISCLLFVFFPSIFIYVKKTSPSAIVRCSYQQTCPDRQLFTFISQFLSFLT